MVACSYIIRKKDIYSIYADIHKLDMTEQLNNNMYVVCVFTHSIWIFFSPHDSVKSSTREVSQLVQSFSHVRLFETPWTAAHQAFLTITNSQSLLKLMSIKSMMASNHLILCCPLLLLPSIFPSIRVFSSESVLCIRWPIYWSFSFKISPSNEHSRLISFRMDWLDLLAVQGTLRSLLQHHSSKAVLRLFSQLFIMLLVYLLLLTCALMKTSFSVHWLTKEFVFITKSEYNIKYSHIAIMYYADYFTVIMLYKQELDRLQRLYKLLGTCIFFLSLPPSLVAQLVKNPPAMWETWVRSLGWEYPLEKGKATHASILAWRIPWTVQSVGSQSVGHD